MVTDRGKNRLMTPEQRSQMKTTNQARKWTDSWVMWPICPWEEPFCLMIFVYHNLNTRTSLLFINGIFTTNCYFAINTVKGVSDSAIVVLWIFITCQDGMLYQFWGVSSYSRDTVDMENHISHFMGWKILVFQRNSNPGCGSPFAKTALFPRGMKLA